MSIYFFFSLFCFLPLSFSSTQTRYTLDQLLSSLPSGHVLLPISPRLQWCWENCPGNGYCGEMSYQSVALYFGSYVSQRYFYEKNGGSQLLVIEGNDQVVAEAFGLKYLAFDINSRIPQINNLVQFVKKSIDSGFPVVMGVYSKGHKDPLYDHIVPVIGYSNDGFYYNLLDIDLITYMTGYSQTRSACNNQNVLDVCIPSQQGWAVSFAGNIISGIRAQLLMDESSEPDYAPEDEINAQPVPISGKLVVSTLQAGLGYSCLRFDSYSLITSNNFLNLNYNKKYDFTAEDSEYTLILGLSEGMISNGQYYYRCQTNPNFDSKDTGSNVDTSKSSISAAFIAALVSGIVLLLSVSAIIIYFYRKRATINNVEYLYSEDSGRSVMLLPIKSEH